MGGQGSRRWGAHLTGAPLRSAHDPVRSDSGACSDSGAVRIVTPEAGTRCAWASLEGLPPTTAANETISSPSPPPEGNPTSLGPQLYKRRGLTGRWHWNGPYGTRELQPSFARTDGCRVGDLYGHNQCKRPRRRPRVWRNGPFGRGSAASKCATTAFDPAIASISEKFGCTSETLRCWVRQVDRDIGRREGRTTGERERIKELEREHRELKRAREILRKASAKPTPCVDARPRRSSTADRSEWFVSSTITGTSTGSRRSAE